MTQCLISAATLAQHVSDPDYVILDCRHDLMNPSWGREVFAAGHIPGAQFAALDTDLSCKAPAADGSFGGRHPLPERDAFIATLRGWGVHPHSHVVAYDAHGGMYAARLWWMLRWVGHDAVQVLDGGLAAWQAQAGALTVDPAPREMGSIVLRTPLVATVSVTDVLDNIDSRQFTLLDARAPDRFRGENETIDPVGGHIPGAKNRFFKDNLSADGRFKSPEQLRTELAALIDNSGHAIMQCGSGVTACHNLLALEVAQMPGARLYPGSWSQWCFDKTRPIATGTD
jgi:thiosulfate/3-mercaptopyruvate sulfurtransferase